MSKIEEIEQAVEKLPVSEFERLAAWIAERQQQLVAAEARNINRDHGGFLRSYSTEDEGLYDDLASR
jgi:hypothetical protein